MTSTTEHINQILIEENQIPTEENQLTLQIDSNFTSTKNIDLGEKSNNKNEDQKEIKINTNPDQIQEQTKTKTKTNTNTTTTTNKKIEDGENLSKNKTNKNQIKKTTTNTTPKTTKKKIFPKNEKKNQKTKPRTLYTTEKPKRSSLNTNKTKKLKLKSINKKNLAEKTNCTNTGNGHEGTLVKTQKKSLNNHRRKTPRLLYSTQKTPPKKLSPKRSHPNFSTIKTKNYTRLHSSKIPPKKTFYNKKYVKTLPSKNKHTNNKSNDNNKEKERENQKHQQKQQTSKIAKKRYAQNHLKKKSTRKKKFKKKVNRKNSIDEDLEIDPNFETRLKTPIRERILKRKMGLSKLDKKTEKRVLRHREKTLEENFSDFPELEKERILKIKELKTPDLNRIKMEQFKKFLSQFDIDFLKQNQKEIEREINKERGLLEQGSKEKTRNTNTKRNRSTNRDQNKTRRKIYNADPKKVRNKLRRFQERTDQHNKAATNKTKKIGYTKNHHRRNVITKKNRQQKQNQNGNRIGKHNANVRQKSKIKLITKSDMPKIPNVQGEMRYNSKTHEWEGNEQELDAFDMKGPTLISNINSTMTFTEFNGMKFNTKEHKWEGNEEEIDWGNSSEDEDFLNSANSTEPDPKNMHKNNDLATNSRYKIKNTFLLDDKTRNKFKNLEKSNKSLMRNWSVDESLFDSKFSIRSFSLSYIVEKSKFL
ncbi:mitotic check point protein bfa1 [Anaeramoeba flamelloides]|uniref:Mitotic check point protein bfa1 n=1 Tax=Anaeramoeba flamelloides TaxID=1746091 RepID=A0ABQ8Y6N0_9EUKA|nr:mitotic check point protein bfa1 [Anaeramoeba flamelloides]